MGNMVLESNGTGDMTLVSNHFIDYYMAGTNGSYVKVYLYLLRHFQAGETMLTLSSIADALDHTESDIRRALNYLEKIHLLALSRAQGKEISGIRLLTPARPEEEKEEEPALTEEKTVTEENAAAPAAPAVPAPVPAPVSDSEKELAWIMKVAERYLERLLNSSDQQLITYLFEEIGFSSELILYLYEYCASRGNNKSAYIEKVALAWADEGIRTIDQAKEASIRYNTDYNAVSKAFGLGRLPGTAERQYIDKWIHQYGFATNLITEACSRALLKTGRPDFRYADGILLNWSKKGIFTPEAVAEEDKAFAGSKVNIPAGSNLPAAKSVVKPAANRFTAFTQHEYTVNDIAELERKLANRP